MRNRALRRWFLGAAGAVLIVSGCAAGRPSSSPTGSVATRASVAPSSEASPTPHPSPPASASIAVLDGEPWISFQWQDPGGGDGIFLVRPDGTGRHQLVADFPGSQRHPDWSPDGHRIVFIQAPPGAPDELWEVDAADSNAKKLITCESPCNEFNYPDWSADGSAIYYGLDANAPPNAPPTTFDVARYDIVSGAVTTVLTRTDGQTAEQARVSPDGKRLVFDRGEIIDTTGMAIFVADLKGGRERRLTDPKLFGAHPDWSPDGRIVFNSYDLGFFQDTTEAANLYTMAADGTDLRQLTTYGEHETRATQPRFTPDGSGIVYTLVDGPGFGTRRLAYMNADGTGRRWLTGEPISGTHPQLRPVTP